MGNNGVSATIVQAAAAHSDPRTTAGYITPEMEPIRNAFEGTLSKMLGTGTGGN